MKKKVFILFLSAFFLFSQYTKEVQASAAVGVLAGAAASSSFPPALAAYIIGGIIVAGGAAVIADEYGDDIIEFSRQVWDSASQDIKDVWDKAVADTLRSGKTVIKLSDDFLNHVQASVDDMSDWIYEKLHTYEASSSVPIVSTRSEYVYLNIDLPFSSPNKFLVGGYLAVWLQAHLWRYDLEVSVYDVKSKSWRTLLKVPYADVPESWKTAFYGVKPNDLNSLNHFLRTVGIGAAVPFIDNSVVPSLDNIKNNVADAVSALKGIKEVNIPLDNFIARTADGKTISFDGTGTATVDGSAYKGEIDWTVPVPGVTGNVATPTLSNPAVPITGVGVGDTILVGEGATTGEATGGGILTDILTGVRTIADVLTTGLVGNPKSINWDKLKMAGSAFTTAFPFSIPWDVGRAFDAVFSLNDLKNTPEWEWKINFSGQQYPIRFRIDDYFLEWFSVIRSVMLIMFDVGLIYAVRKMLGGAS